MKKWNGKKLSAFFFPPKCIGCGELMSITEGAEDVFCPFCRTAWEAGRLSEDDRYQPWDGCISGSVSVVKYRSGETDGVPEKLIYHLKHRDERRVFDFAACELTPLIKIACTSLSIAQEDIWLSYPPRRQRAVRRDGFDQAQRLAQAVSRRMGSPVVPLLKRTKERSGEQKRLSAKERHINASSAYKLLNKSDVSGKTVVLLDDVYTTGATLRVCGKLLLDAGAARVIFATVGRTIHQIRKDTSKV